MVKVDDLVRGSAPTMLHVVVGHGLPRYFLNCIESVRATAPQDRVLVIDNASPDSSLRSALKQMADKDEMIDLVLRSSNESQNRKVGGLYDAYKIAFEYAVAEQFDLLHVLQGDFQMMWWDDELIEKSLNLYAAHPSCVNIQMQILSHDKKLTDELIPMDDGLLKLRKYGLTDTGLYHLGRWTEREMRFSPDEQGHSRYYLDKGLEVLCHPWPTDAPIPWPAVVRNGIQRGREVATDEPFLLRPLHAEDIAFVKESAGEAWLEDICIPWGWVCATPMWVSGLDSIDYWVLRYRDAKENGLRHILPRVELRGVADEKKPAAVWSYPYRPPLADLLLGAPTRELARRWRNRRSALCRGRRSTCRLPGRERELGSLR
jgi:hypothetical protein